VSSGFDGQTNNNIGHSDLMLMKLSSAGAHQWTVLRGGSTNEFAYSLKAGRAELFVVHVPTHLLEKHWHGEFQEVQAALPVFWKQRAIALKRFITHLLNIKRHLAQTPPRRFVHSTWGCAIFLSGTLLFSGPRAY